MMKNSAYNLVLTWLVNGKQQTETLRLQSRKAAVEVSTEEYIVGQERIIDTALTRGVLLNKKIVRSVLARGIQ